jgi:hypothetical protein
MKRTIFMLCIIFIISFNVGCNCDKSNTPSKKRIIHGIAATGAVIEEGALVQVRPAPINGQPSDILIATVGSNGEYVVEIPETIPDVTEKKYITPQAGTGYIIRIYSTSASSWLYSYSENDGSDTVANVNPYTDRIIRSFYAQMNNMAYPFIGIYDQDIDNIFPSGIFSDGITAVNIPEKATIDQIMTVISNMLKDTYNLTDIQNALTSTWDVGLGLDKLLDDAAGGSGHLAMWLQNEFNYLYQFPDALISSSIYEDDYNPVTNTIHIDIWTAYGNTGNVTLSGITGFWLDTLLIKQSDSVPGNNHYSATIIFNVVSGYHGDYVTITIDDYNSGSGFPIALKRY